MINLDENYRLDNDERCYILQERKISKSGKSEGEERWENVSYHLNLRLALEKYRDIGVKKLSQAADGMKIDKLITLIKEQDDAFLQTITEILEV